MSQENKTQQSLGNEYSNQEPQDTHWLKTFQELQSTAFAAQQQFQQTLAESHFSFLELTKIALKEIGRLSSGRESLSDLPETQQPSPLRHDKLQKTNPLQSSTAAHTSPSSASPVSREAPQHTLKPLAAPSPLPKMMPQAPKPFGQKPGGWVPPTPQIQPASTQTSAKPIAPTSVAEPKKEVNKESQTLLYTIIAEKTGYPIDILEPHMELESELGIDSIKRVEIISALKDKIPNLKNEDQADLAKLRTLQSILDVIERLSGENQKKNS